MSKELIYKLKELKYTANCDADGAHEHNAAVDRCIAIVRQHTDWQPISTAPRDGMRFLGVVAGFLPTVAWWTEKHGWMNEKWNAELELATQNEMYQPSIEGPWQLTHWMPIPEPPSPCIGT